MERLTEEQITKFLIKYLRSIDFKIFAYDFPQSGTGYIIRPNSSKIKHKNINFWIPDIIAVKNNCLYLFENKDHYSLSDIKKIQKIFREDSHSEAIIKLLGKTKTLSYFVLLGYPLRYFNEINKLSDFINAEIGCDITNNKIQLKAKNEKIRKNLFS